MKHQLQSKQSDQLASTQFKHTARGAASFGDKRSASVAQYKLQDAANGSAKTVAQRALNQQVERRMNPNGLPNQLKTGIEAMSGMDMSGVRIHANSDKPAQLNALAFAQGNDIHLGRGQEQHLPHEAWHVVQQRQGRVQPTAQLHGAAINDDAGLEHEADVMGSRAAQLQTMHPVQLRAGSGAAVMQFGLGEAVKYGALGAVAGVVGATVGAALLPAAATATTLGLLGGGIGALYGALTNNDEQSDGPQADDMENEYPDGHDADDEGGLEEQDLPNAQLKDIDGGEDPDLYAEIELITRGIRDLRISQHKTADATPAQLARKAGPSYQAGYNTENFGQFTEITYMRDGKGAIDFKSPTKKKKWKNPVDSKIVDLEKGSSKKGYGITQGNKLAHIQSASRAVHFSIANRITKQDGSGSPDGWTWHHLVSPYKMVLVDRQVHRKHGHNGGKLLWK